MDRLVKDVKLADGGAAMTAYAKMQFSEMSEQEAVEVAARCCAVASWTPWP